MAKRKNRQRILNINRMKKRLCDKEEYPIDFGDAVVSEETQENDTPRIVAEKTETTNEDESLPTSSVKKMPPCRRELKMLSSTSRIRKTSTVVSPDNHAPTESQEICGGNRLVDWESLRSMIENNTICIHCQSPLKLTEDTVGIATSIHLDCRKCKIKEKTVNLRTKLRSDKGTYKVSESYATNVQFVLGVEQIGGGPADSQILITYLGLPHSSSFGSKTFGKIEAKIRPVIKKICNESIEKGLDEEVQKTRTSEDYARWKEGTLPAQANGLTVCYDMGWNKRSSGNRYDSISGHGIVFGAMSKKVIAYRAVSKACSYCDIFKKKNSEIAVVDTHDCVRNHWGSSKSMECEAILHITKDAWENRRYHLHCICSDDDTTMKKILRHNYDQMIRDGLLEKANKPKATSVRLDAHIIEPQFIADFNHRIKSVGRALYKLAGMNLSESKVTNDIAKRLKLYWSELLNKVKHLDIEKDWEIINKKC